MALKNEHGEVCVEVDPSCRELIDDLEQVLLDGRGKIKKVTNRTDPYFKRTHISDGFGYWICRDAPVRPINDRHRPKVMPKAPGYAFSGAA